MADEHLIQAEILTPEGKIYEGELFQVSARTVVGEVGVRARHAPMLARLVASELRLYESRSAFSSGQSDTYVSAEGWMEVFANRVVVLVEEAHAPEDLDPSRIREQIAEIEARIEDAEDGSAAEETAKHDLVRAQAFLKAAEGN